MTSPARTVLYGVLQHSGANLSAHQTIEAEYATYGSIDRLAAELETIAADAQKDRFADLLRRSGLTQEQHDAVLGATAFGPLAAAMRRAEAYHHDLERLTPRVVRQHGLDDANDIAAVLKHRLDKATARAPRDKRGLKPHLIAGLIPEPLGPMSDEDHQAIAERKHLIEERARALAQQAVTLGEPWTRRLGAQSHDAQDRERWLKAASTVAAYRDRYGITSNLPAGGGAATDAQRADRRRGLAAARTAMAAAEKVSDRHAPANTAWTIPSP
jgi:hypothetical protein